MNIFFKTLNGRTVVVDISEVNTLRELRFELSKRAGIPIEELNIIYAGTLLDNSVYDNLQLSTMQVPYSGETKSFLDLVSHLTVLHIVQRKCKSDSTSTSLDFTEPKLYWRVRQSDKFKDIDNYPLEEKELDSITVCETLEDAFKASKTRQENNKDNNKISIIEAIVIDKKQNLLTIPAGEKYGNALSLISQDEKEKVKVATVGYFKQSSPQFVTLNESTTTSAQKNKEIVDEVNLSIGRLLQSSHENIESPDSITSEEASKKLIVENFFKSSNNPFPENSLGYEIYEELIDPISFEIMKNAVILPSGHTFSRESIEALDKCPITRASFGQNAIEANPRINKIIELLALSQNHEDNKFKENLGNIIINFNYDKETFEPRDYKLERIIECLKKIENKENQIPVTDKNQLNKLEFNPDLSSSEPTLSLDPESKNKIAQALQTYINRIESYNRNYRLNLSHKFFQGSQAVNREANYLLAKQLIQSLDNHNNLLREIFSDSYIKQQRDKIITDNNLPEKANETYYNLGIHSKELNEAIGLARQLLAGESNTSSLEVPSPSKT